MQAKGQKGTQKTASSNLWAEDQMFNSSQRNGTPGYVVGVEDTVMGSFQV